VTGVEAGSAGDEAGLRRGDVILEVDRKPVKTVAEYRKVVGEASKRGKGILFLVRRGESTLFLALKPQP
ncbi:MAG: PDZ domain-containing protein, partial [Deltaproteobacteria bacterium]|nr:PDZ domain-containing protein [Deltaproteobacteria bacterium]